MDTFVHGEVVDILLSPGETVDILPGEIVVDTFVHGEVVDILLLPLEIVDTFQFVSGMQYRPFRGLPSIQEVTCSGHTLEADVSIYAMSLFAVPAGRILAFVDLKDNVCSTSDVFAACVIEVSDPRRTRLVALVQDLGLGESRVYGCNITGTRGGKLHVVAWEVPVPGPSRSSLKSTP